VYLLNLNYLKTTPMQLSPSMNVKRQSMATGKQPGKYKETGSENQTNNSRLEVRINRI
jgi:hypothetical protein